MAFESVRPLPQCGRRQDCAALRAGALTRLSSLVSTTSVGKPAARTCSVQLVQQPQVGSLVTVIFGNAVAPIAGAAASAARKPRRESAVIADAASAAFRGCRGCSVGSKVARASACRPFHPLDPPPIIPRPPCCIIAIWRQHPQPPTLGALLRDGRSGFQTSGWSRRRVDPTPAHHPARCGRASSRPRGARGAAAHLSRCRRGPGESENGRGKSKAVFAWYFLQVFEKLGPRPTERDSQARARSNLLRCSRSRPHPRAHMRRR